MNRTNLPLEKTFIIDTGNIFNLGIIQRKILNDPNVEVFEGLETVLDWYANNNINKWDVLKLKSNQIDFNCLRITEQFKKSKEQNYERSKLKLSVKLFLFPEIYEQQNEYRKLIIEESVEVICNILKIDHIDNLILSIQTNDVEQVVPRLKSFWSVCEDFVTNEKVHSLGTSDLNYGQLVDFYKSVVKVKPSSTQINLDSCCDIPADLSLFAKENSIQLLTHNDPSDGFIPIEQLENLLKTKNDYIKDFILESNNQLKRKWLARYTFVLRGQGVVLSKGYLISILI